MASEIGKIVHCKICGAPIEARGNRLYCPVCYNQNRRNAAQRSNARTKMEREQTHGMEFSAWVHEWEKLNSGTQADGLKFPDHLPEGFPTRRKPPEHPWTKSTSCK